MVKGLERTAACMSMITFNDNDMCAEVSNHNRPLFITGHILTSKVSRVMVDGGSAVNLLPRRALSLLSVPLSHLRPSHLVIQGFNQNEQRPMGKIRLQTKFGDIKEDTEFLVIDMDTSYNALLGPPWVHNHHAIPSTFHQRIKYPLSSKERSEEEGTIVADSDPFNGVEAYYVDARFYSGTSQKKDKGKNLKKTEDTQAPGTKSFQYIPRSERKPGASALVPINPTLELKDKFILPLRKTECTYVDTYNKFVVPPKEKGSKPIRFHAMGDLEQKVNEEQVSQTADLINVIKPKYSAKTTRMLVKLGLDPEKTSTEGIAPFDAILTHPQRVALQQGKPIISTKEGLGYREPSTENQLSVNMTTTEKVTGNLHEEEDKETYLAPRELKEGGQATIDELREVNLGDEGENKPTFISANLTEQESQKYIMCLKAYRDVFAWNYIEMPGLDPRVAVHKLAIHPEKQPVKQPQRRT